VSATLVDIPDIGSILLDAGESTYGQMLRMAGAAGIDESINNLKAIFISHLHADHHLGVVQVLSKWFEVRVDILLHTTSKAKKTHHFNMKLNNNTNKKMFVISPWAFKLWLEEYADVQDFGLKKLVFINNEDILYNKYNEASSMQRYSSKY
jgi:ribonuclease Z